MATSIRLNKQTKTIKIVNRRANIRLTNNKVHNITLHHTGKTGPQGSGDKNYTTMFSPTDSLVVTHGLNKYPAVSIMNSAGDEVEGNVQYLTVNSLMVSFSAAFGGRITCN